jgi:hypothetical protein
LGVREISNGGLGDVANVVQGFGAHGLGNTQPPYLE